MPFTDDSATGEVSMTQLLQELQGMRKENQLQLEKIQDRVSNLEADCASANSVNGGHTGRQGKQVRFKVKTLQVAEESSPSVLKGAGDGFTPYSVEDDSDEDNRGHPVHPSTISLASGTGFSIIQMEDLQTEFRLIHDSLSRQRLPQDLKFQCSKAGIKSASRETAKTLSKVAKHMETALKIAHNLQALIDTPCYNPKEEIEDLLVVLVSLMQFVQEDHAVISRQSHLQQLS